MPTGLSRPNLEDAGNCRTVFAFIMECLHSSSVATSIPVGRTHRSSSCHMMVIWCTWCIWCMHAGQSQLSAAFHTSQGALGSCKWSISCVCMYLQLNKAFCGQNALLHWRSIPRDSRLTILFLIAYSDMVMNPYSIAVNGSKSLTILHEGWKDQNIVRTYKHRSIPISYALITSVTGATP